MATSTPTLSERRASARRSSVALKSAMAVSGLIMVLFLLAHMYGNLKVFWGQAAFDDYSHHLRVLGEPMLPREGALWIIRVVLLAAVLIHIYAAVTLWRRAHKATTVGGGRRYQSTKNRRGIQRSYASFTMRWGGVVVVAFIIFHLLNLTTNDIHPGGASDSPYERVIHSFSYVWVVISYTIALLAVGFHLRHGFWSALATLGANTGPKRRRNLDIVATALALIITVGFLLPPWAVLFGWVS